MRKHTVELEDSDWDTKIKFHNTLPLIAIIGLTISAVTGFNLVANKVEQQSQQITYVNTKAEACLSDLHALQNNTQQQELNLKEIETRLNIRGEVKGISTSSGFIQRVPTPQPKK